MPTWSLSHRYRAMNTEKNGSCTQDSVNYTWKLFNQTSVYIYIYVYIFNNIIYTA